jgi:hypothetical protein
MGFGWKGDWRSRLVFFLALRYLPGCLSIKSEIEKERRRSDGVLSRD